MLENDPTPTENEKKKKKNQSILLEGLLYFSFAFLMVLLNMGIQNVHNNHWIPWLTHNWGDQMFLQNTYLSTDSVNVPELTGSVIAVGVTYLIKYVLDKYVVFQSKTSNLKETGKEFSLYFIFAIFTTLENLGIQLLLGILTLWTLNLRIALALSCGYITKFVLDRTFSFTSRGKSSENLKKN